MQISLKTCKWQFNTIQTLTSGSNALLFNVYLKHSLFWSLTTFYQYPVSVCLVRVCFCIIWKLLLYKRHFFHNFSTFSWWIIHVFPNVKIAWRRKLVFKCIHVNACFNTNGVFLMTLSTDFCFSQYISTKLLLIFSSYRPQKSKQRLLAIFIGLSCREMLLVWV